ncbi:hypothetical protein ACN6K5_004509 [Streptomyces violaceoruber]
MPSPAPSAPTAIRGSRSIRADIALPSLAPAAEHSHPLGVVA